MMYYELIKMGVVNANNRIYSKKVVQEIIDKIKSDEKIPCYIDYQYEYDYSLPIMDIAGSCGNFHIDGDSLYCDLEILETPKGKLLTILLHGLQTVLRTAIIATVEFDDDGVSNVKEGKISYIAAVPLATDAFNKTIDI